MKPDASSQTARKGKIARLPADIRGEVCQRLLDGKTGSEILSWLNAIPGVKKILSDRFDGKPISDSNLTEWRQGGYQDWLDEQKQVRDLRAKSELALSIARASNGQLSEGAAAIAAGKLLELMEGADAKTIVGLSKAAAMIRDGDIELKKMAKTERDEVRADRKLDLEESRERRAFCKDFMKWWGDKRAAAIIEGKDSNPVKMDKLVQLMFGDRPTRLMGPLQIPGGKAELGS